MNYREKDAYYGQPRIYKLKDKNKTYKGMFWSDIHDVKSIDLDPLFDYMKDLQPDLFILGGDTVEVAELLMADSLKFDAIKLNW